MTQLPPGWIKIPVTEFTKLHDSRRVPLNAKQRDGMRGPFPYYGANGLVDHVNDYLFDGEYTLLAEDGGYFDDPKRGVAYEVSGKFWVNNHAHILEPLGGITNRFLCYALNSTDWMPFVGGSTRLKLTQGGLEQACIGLPPLAEQQRLVAKIDSLSAKSRRARDHLDHIPRLVEKYKQAILAVTFNSTRFGGWQRGELEKFVTDALIGLVRSRTEQSWTHGTPYIRMNHFNMEGDWNTDDLTFVEVSDGERERYQLRSGDLVFNTRNSFELVGKVAVWPDGRPGFVYNNNLLRVRLIPEIDPRFAWLFMMSPPFRDYLQSVKSATTSVCAIYQRSIMAAPFAFPPLDEQRAIVGRLLRARAWIDRLACEATNARRLIDHLNQAVLAKAFRGELVPQDLNDEPASVLLERIRQAKGTDEAKVKGRGVRGRSRAAPSRA